MNNSGILLAIIAMFGFGLGNGLAKIPSSKFPYQKQIFYRNIFSSVAMLIVLLFLLNGAHFDFKYILLAFLLSIIGYAGLASFYKALSFGDIGIISPVANSYALITISLAIIFLDERLSSPQLTAIFSILFGLIFISINIRKFRHSHIFNAKSGIPYALLACLIWGFYFFAMKFLVDRLGPILSAFIIEFGTLISCFVEIKIKKIEYQSIKSRDLSIILASSFLVSLAVILYDFAIQSNNVSLISAISSASPLVAVLFGKLVYKDKLSLSQYAAITLILIGIVSLSYFK